MTPTQIECSGYVPDGQQTRYRETFLIGDAKVRVIISLDRSYDSQSTATAEVWSPQMMKWNNIAGIVSGEWVDGPTRPIDVPEVIQGAVDNLVGQAISILT